MQCRFIKGYEDYLIFADGNVYSKKSQRMLKPRKVTRGYVQVVLYNGDSKKALRVHRIVAEAFLPNPENKPEINHINGNKSDNRVENLEWCTRSENMIHAKKTGLNNPEEYLSKPIVQYTCDGTLIRSYLNSVEAEKYTGICCGSISRVCRGKRKSAGGYVWRYVEDEF